jgi:hypothetical protein
VVGLALVLVGGLGATGMIGTDPTGVFENLLSGQRSTAEEPAAAEPDAPAVDSAGTGPADEGGVADKAPPGESPEITMENAAGTGPQDEQDEDFQAIASQALSWVYVVAIGLALLVVAFVMWAVGTPRRLTVRR